MGAGGMMVGSMGAGGGMSFSAMKVGSASAGESGTAAMSQAGSGGHAQVGAISSNIQSLSETSSLMADSFKDVLLSCMLLAASSSDGSKGDSQKSHSGEIAAMACGMYMAAAALHGIADGGAAGGAAAGVAGVGGISA